ncbi:MAG TPA: FAD binding domain-containing protein, partial [Acidimicrobiia bacterium]|nr:FAD binding domain-containing protein [Acidimicrobiia bacterium]
RRRSRRSSHAVKMPPFRYHRPDTADEALRLLRELGSDAKVLAGGQSLLPLLALRLSRPEHLVDISAISDLAGIEESESGTVVGAAVRHAGAERSPLLERRAPLAAAAMPLIGHRAIRSRGTVCGSLAHADPAAELPAVTLALDAEMVVRRAGAERRVPARDFFLGYLTSALDDDEMLAAVRFPAWPERTGFSIQEVSRRHGDYALVGLAAVLGTGADGRVERAALSFFGAGSTPVRVAEAAATVTKAIDPPDDNHATAAYRAHVAGVLTRRCLAEAAGRIGVAA